MRHERAAGRGPVGTGEALRAVHHVASDLGLPMATPVVLHATNNVVVHLVPAAVVAKVSRSVPVAARELDVAP